MGSFLRIDGKAVDLQQLACNAVCRYMPIPKITANIARPRVVSVNAVSFQGLNCTYLVLGIVVELLHDAVGGVSFYGSVALVKNEQIQVINLHVTAQMAYCKCAATPVRAFLWQWANTLDLCSLTLTQSPCRHSSGTQNTPKWQHDTQLTRCNIARSTLCAHFVLRKDSSKATQCTLTKARRRASSKI